MAGVSTKEIKSRIRSMESTKQITKAMEMVAASKLRHAQAQVANSRPYFEIIYKVIQDIAAASQEHHLPYMEERTGGSGRLCCIVIAGDRGLAGGYNSNILKACYSEIAGRDCAVLPIGRRAVEFFRARHLPLVNDRYADAEDVGVGDCFTIARSLCKAYLAGEYDEIRLGYTFFHSVLSQRPGVMRLLPLTREGDGGKAAHTSDILYEPGGTQALLSIIPEYIGGVLYGALCESRASEQAARRTAMDTATQNAEDMIASLSLKYNQARQAAITQEITEIVAGA